MSQVWDSHRGCTSDCGYCYAPIVGLATSLVAVGFFTGTGPLASLAGLASGIGGNWAARLAERGFQHWSTQWSRELSVGSGHLADGLSVALQRAVSRVTPELEREERYLGLRHRDKDAATQLLDSLKALGDNAAMVARVKAWAGEGACVRQAGRMHEAEALFRITQIVIASSDYAMYTAASQIDASSPTKGASS